VADACEIWIARCKPLPGQPGATTAAVWAASLAHCEATLRISIDSRGLVWPGLDEALPLRDLQEDVRGALPLKGLQELLGPETPVVFRKGQVPLPRIAVGHKVTTLPFSGPEDAMSPINVPEDLAPALFPADKRTFAILDAAQIQGLVDMMDAWEMQYRCLYKGKLAEDLRDLAPYLVHLRPYHKLTGWLFKDGAAPSHLWDTDYGCFVLSEADIDTLQAHFRHYNTVQTDGSDHRLFLRFWSNPVLCAMARHPGPDPLISGLLGQGAIVFRDLTRVDGPAVKAMELDV
jgi:hypothetical protein